MIVVDTGPLVAAATVGDRWHEPCVALFTRARNENRPLIVPAFVAATTSSVLRRTGGGAVEAAFLRSLWTGSVFVLEALQVEDLGRVIELVEAYADLPLDATDASVVAVAERLRVPDVAALSPSPVALVRPRHVPALEVLPAE